MSAFRALSVVSRAARSASAARAFSVAGRIAGSSKRGFSVSARVFGEGSSDSGLVAKLSEELKYEKEAAPADASFLTEFKEQGIWKLEDAPFGDEVSLSRKFGNEAIRVVFSISDIQGQEEDYPPSEDAENVEENEPVAPIRAAFTIVKEGVTGGALNIDTIVQDGAFIVDNISFYRDAKIGTELTAEADWVRRGKYIGPQFDTLDISVQEEFEKFLNERGIDESLATFIPLYAEHKEQKEYVQWLQGVKGFISA